MGESPAVLHTFASFIYLLMSVIYKWISGMRPTIQLNQLGDKLLISRT